MLTTRFSMFWPTVTTPKAVGRPPKPRPSPVFIGDAVQPWGRDTLLLDILRRDADRDQPSE